jgi:hypothetical protein
MKSSARILALGFCVVTSSMVAQAQQVIGSFPTMDGGCESQTSGTIASTTIATGLQRADWTVQNTSGTRTITATGGRSGPYFLTFGATAGRRLQSPTVNTDGSITNTTQFTIQFYYRTSGATAPSNVQIGVSPDGSGSPGTYVSASLSATSGTWTKFAGQATSGTSANSPKYGIGIIRFSAASAADIDVDDFVMYAGTTDNTAPDPVTSPSVSNPSQTSLDVSWTAPASGVDGGGYVVVRGTSDPSTVPNTNGIYAVGNTVTTGQTVAYIGNSTSYTDNGLSSGTTYYYRVYTVDKAFNYSSAAATNGTTSSAPGSTSSNIVTGNNEASSGIDYANYQATSFSANTDGVQVWSFTIQDGGGSADADELSTILTDVTIGKGGSNTVSSWASTIREAALYNGSTKIAEVSVIGDTIDFAGLSGASVTAADDGSTTIDLYLTFEAAVTDNQQCQFKITSASYDNTGSGFAESDAGAAASAVTGSSNKILVNATKLRFIQQPTMVRTGSNISPNVSVEATDGNNNRDLDFTGTVTISATGATINGTPSGGASSGIANVSSVSFSTTGTGVTLTGSSSPLTEATSSVFDIKDPLSSNDIMVSHYSPRYNAASDEFVVLFNNTDAILDIGAYEVAYASASGGSGTQRISWTSSTTVAARSYYLCATNSDVTVGSVSNRAADKIYASFAADNGQIAIRETSTGTVIYAMATGTITSYAFGLSTSTSTTTTSAGMLKLTASGNTYSRSGDNDADYTLVAAASITDVPNSDIAALPVEMACFSATANRLAAEVHWSTSTEVDNSGFEIERKCGATGWTKVGFVSGSGTSTSLQTYSYTDEVPRAGLYEYRLKQIDRSGTFKYSDVMQVEVGMAPKVLALGSNYPNPFNPATSIEFSVPRDGRAVLKIYNTLGQEVATLFDGNAVAGTLQKANFDASRLASGVYYSRLEFGGQALVKRMMLVK